MKRSLGMKSDTIQEQELGTKEVICTMKALMYYDKRIPELKHILTKYAGS
ncbi:hypothetical protein ACFQI7_22965 [Paenibacillus allorhizosphaerae]|nr:hypothetical protein [Paenibacillus allorhizosphaerae]